MTKIHQTFLHPDAEYEDSNNHTVSEDAANSVHVESNGHALDVSTSKVFVTQSPYLDVFYEHMPALLTIDTGATGNMIRVSVAKQLGANIQKARSQLTRQMGHLP